MSDDEPEQPMETRRWLGVPLTVGTATRIALVFFLILPIVAWVGWFVDYDAKPPDYADGLGDLVSVLGAALAMGLVGVSYMRELGQRGFPALGVFWVLGTWLFCFAHSYWEIGRPGFGEDLSRLDATYLALTTATTTGFGDITPDTPLARGLVSAQMVTGFVLLVVGVASVVASRTDKTGVTST
jgi:hypothetical protein